MAAARFSLAGLRGFSAVGFVFWVGVFETGALADFSFVGLAVRGLTADLAAFFLAAADFFGAAAFFLVAVFFTDLRATLARARVGRVFLVGRVDFFGAVRPFPAGDFFVAGRFFFTARLAGAAFAGRRVVFFLVRGDFRADAFFFPMGCGISVWG